MFILQGVRCGETASELTFPRDPSLSKRTATGFPTLGAAGGPVWEYAGKVRRLRPVRRQESSPRFVQERLTLLSASVCPLVLILTIRAQAWPVSEWR